MVQWEVRLEHLKCVSVCVLFQIRWEKNITLGEPPGFLHSWWWYVTSPCFLVVVFCLFLQALVPVSLSFIASLLPIRATCVEYSETHQKAAYVFGSSAVTLSLCPHSLRPLAENKSPRWCSEARTRPCSYPHCQPLSLAVSFCPPPSAPLLTTTPRERINSLHTTLLCAR